MHQSTQNARTQNLIEIVNHKVATTKKMAIAQCLHIAKLFDVIVVSCLSADSVYKLGFYVLLQACDIKDPKQNIEWTVPEGGGGPVYTNM